MAVVAAAVAVALAACIPLAREGWLFLLDWQRGPHVPLPQAVWGLDGAPPTAVPFALAAWAVGRVVGPATVVWLPILVALLCAVVGAGHLVGGSASRRVSAGLVYAVNPFVYDRLFAGHVSFLLAYALLPFAVASLVRTDPHGSVARWARPALWVTLLVALTPHSAWLVTVVCLVLLAVDRSRANLTYLAVVAAAVVATNAYLLVPVVSGEGATVVNVDTHDLVAYRTAGEPPLGVLGNVVTLHGFWRQELPLPRDDVPGWPLFQAGLLVVSAAGATAGWRRHGDRRLVQVVIGAGAAGALLAAGDLGPAGAAYRWLFLNAPGFEVMREPQKFAALVALAYAVLFGLGTEALAGSAVGRRTRRWWTATALVLPIAATPTLFWGLGGRLEVARYPTSWAEADEVMGDGAGRILFLPWHQYLAFPFTDRVVANPAPYAFRRDVIVGDNVELPGLRTASSSERSAYLEFLLSRGEDMTTFGQLVAPHAVEYVVLARTADWRGYDWLDRQTDLVRVLDRPEIVVYRNSRTVRLGSRLPSVTTVEDWGELVGLSERADLSGTAVFARRLEPGPVRPPHDDLDASPSGAGLRRVSPVRYRVPPGPPAWVALAEPFDDTWRLDGSPAVPLAWGGPGFSPDSNGGDVRLARWSSLRLGYAVSLATVALLALAGLRPWRSGRTLAKFSARTTLDCVSNK